jgi:HSF-type DNA-binding
MCLAASHLVADNSYYNAAMMKTIKTTTTNDMNKQHHQAAVSAQVVSSPSLSLEAQMVLPTSLSSRLLAVPSMNGGSHFLNSNIATISLGGMSSGDESEDSSSGCGIVKLSQQQQSRSQSKKNKKSANTTTTTTTGTGTGTYNKKKGSFTTKGYKRHFAVHNYTDYSRVRPTQEDLQNGMTISKGGVHNPFPAVLHRMMEDLDSKGFTDLCSWQPHGRAFLIKEPKGFVSDVLPLYFKHSKLSSFQRQLSLYGFKRLTSDGLDRGAYYHPCFLRGRPFLCSKIQRTRVKGTWVRTSSSPKTEPNFYMMDPVRDLTSDDDHDDESDSFSDDTDLEAPTIAAGCSTTSTVHSSYASNMNEMGAAAANVFHTPTATPHNEKKKVQITFDLFDDSALSNTALLPPPSLPTSILSDKPTMATESVVVARTTSTTTSQNIHYIGTAMSIVGFDEGADALRAPVAADADEAMPFIQSLHDDAELASFLSDIDLDIDPTTIY